MKNSQKIEKKTLKNLKLGKKFGRHPDKLDHSFTFMEKDRMTYFSMFLYYIFFVWILRPELRIYLQGGRFFDKLENIIHELR